MKQTGTTILLLTFAAILGSACNESRGYDDCYEGSRICDGEKVMQCISGKYVEVVDCVTLHSTCNASTTSCLVSAAPVPCLESSIRCISEAPSTCTNGNWVSKGVCPPDTFCNSNSGDCTPRNDAPCDATAAATCNDGELARCSITGKWVTEKCGNGTICDADAKMCRPLVAPTCAVGATTINAGVKACVDNTIVSCGASANDPEIGALETVQACGDGLCVVDGSDARCLTACELTDGTELPSGEAACSDGVVSTCGNDFKVSAVSCASGKCAEDGVTCEPSACKGPTGEEVAHGDSVCFNDTDFVGFKKCDDGNFIETDPCGDNERCSEFAGKPGCYEKHESAIGGACTCDGGDGVCYNRRTGADAKALLTSGNTNIAPLFDMISDDSQIDIPLFYPGAGNIKGCDDITVPDGMELGCYRKADIRLSSMFSKSLIEAGLDSIYNNYRDSIARKFGYTFDAVTGLGPCYDKATGTSSSDRLDCTVEQFVNDAFEDKMQLNVSLSELRDGVKALAVKAFEDLSFDSEAGYCIVGAFDMDITPNGVLGQRLLSSRAVAERIAPYKTGDHATAGSATCPDGSVLVSYDFSERYLDMLDALGTGDITMDMCLKSCASDGDCDAANKCVSIPKSIANGADSVDKVQVCFDPSVIKHFEDIKAEFERVTDI